MKAKECLELGKCKACGCSTPELFLADKSCENDPPCYPPMMSAEVWKNYQEYLSKSENEEHNI